MRILMLLLLTTALCFGGFLPSQTFTDTRDGQEYRTIEVGGKVWLAENFNFDSGEGTWCYAKNPENCEKWGRLYTLEAARAAVPEGWHLPTVEEWDAAIESFGGEKEAFLGSKHFFKNADEVAAEVLKGMNIDAFGGCRLGDERKQAKPHLADLSYLDGGEFGGYWAESGKLNQFGRPCPTSRLNNCAVFNVGYLNNFHWEICDDAFETDGFSLRLVKD
jgi:uncharacterized protein (TIGR02145 family)